MARGALNEKSVEEIAGLAVEGGSGKRTPSRRFAYRGLRKAKRKRGTAKRRAFRPSSRKAIFGAKKAKKRKAKKAKHVFPRSKAKRVPARPQAKEPALKPQAIAKAPGAGGGKIASHVRRLEEIESAIQRLVGKKKALAKPKPLPKTRAEKQGDRTTRIAARAVAARTAPEPVEPYSAEETSRSVFSMMQRAPGSPEIPEPSAQQGKPWQAGPAAFPPQFMPQSPPALSQAPVPPGQAPAPVPMPSLPSPQPLPAQQPKAIPNGGQEQAYAAPIGDTIPSFLPAIDNAFKGGFSAGSVVVIDSPYQAEAKLLMLNLASLALKNNEPVLYITLDDSAEGIASKAQRAGLGFSEYYDKGTLYCTDGFSKFYGQQAQQTERIARIAGPTALTEMSAATFKAISNFFLFGRYYKVAQVISGMGDSEKEVKGIQAYPKLFLDSVSTLFYFFQPDAIQRFLLAEKSKLKVANVTVFLLHNSKPFGKDINERLRQNVEYYITMDYENENILLRVESSASLLAAREIRLKLTPTGYT